MKKHQHHASRDSGIGVNIKSCNVSATGLAGHKTEGEHRKCTHHETDNLRAAIKKIPSLR